MRLVRRIGAPALVLTALAAPALAGASPANVAALQSALQGLQLYSGYVDGIRGDGVYRGRHGSARGGNWIAGERLCAER